MKLRIEDQLSIASGAHNEDRAGAGNALAWVIDGATDVLAAPLTRAPTDAVWFARAMQEAMDGIAAAPSEVLADIPALIAARLAPAFANEASRAPDNAGEHPSASGIVIRIREGALDYVSLGDCTLIVETDATLSMVCVDEEEAGDRWVADALTGHALDASTRTAPLTRADLLPRLRAQRALMNTESGYAIFSITAPPPAMVRHGTLPIAAGSRILLASDGLMRLVDVFRCYGRESLFAAAWANGLAPLAAELRGLETADSDCVRFPRAKIADDATAVLLRVTAPA